MNIGGILLCYFIALFIGFRMGMKWEALKKDEIIDELEYKLKEQTIISNIAMRDRC